MCKAWDDHKELGRIMGREEGVELGRSLGREEGRESGVCAAVKMCKAMKVSVQEAVENISVAFSLTPETAQQKVNLYW